MCHHRPTIKLVQYLGITNSHDLHCKYCGKAIKLNFKAYIFLLVIFLLYLSSGILYLLLVHKFDKPLICILIIGGIVYHTIKFLLYKYSKYDIINGTEINNEM